MGLSQEEEEYISRFHRHGSDAECYRYFMLIYGGGLEGFTDAELISIVRRWPKNMKELASKVGEGRAAKHGRMILRELASPFDPLRHPRTARKIWSSLEAIPKDRERVRAASWAVR